MEQNGYADAGSLKISEDVLATIAGMATSEIKGVAGLSLRPSSDLKGFVFNKKGPGKAIRLEMKDGEATIDIFVNLYIGFKIPDVASEIQARVKEEMQNMTGITVSKVNVHITGVVIDQSAGKRA
jgi:uncharacterized alkaline shock family protein YloU